MQAMSEAPKYLGAALQSFVRAVRNEMLTSQILERYEISKIDAGHWYDFKVAQAIYRDIGKELGPASLQMVGRKIIDSAVFPPQIQNATDALASIDVAYHMNIRGDGLGKIEFESLGPNTAQLTFSTPFPCNLDQGIAFGCCTKYGAVPTVSHVEGSCRDEGDAACQYKVRW